MTEKKLKNLKNLKRSELLEILLEQTKEVERLKGELEIAKKALENRKIMMQSVGSIAEASLKVSNIFEDAQKAADMYLDNIRTIEHETWQKAQEIIEEAYKKYGLKPD